MSKTLSLVILSSSRVKVRFKFLTISYEIMDDAAQAFLKTKIMDNIQVNGVLPLFIWWQVYQKQFGILE